MDPVTKSNSDSGIKVKLPTITLNDYDLSKTLGTGIYNII